MPTNIDTIIISGLVVLDVVFFTMAIIFKLYPPTTINGWYGYRTRSSMRNIHTWNEANRYSTNYMFIIAFVNTGVSVLSYLLIGGVEAIQITGGSLALLTVSTMIVTEIHLKKKFDSEGNLK